MTFLQFLGYFLLADLLVSGVVFVILYKFRDKIKSNITNRLIGMISVDNYDKDSFEEGIDGTNLKPAMMAAMDEVFKLKKR